VPQSAASPSTPSGAAGAQDCTQPNFTQIINSSSLDVTHGGAQYTCAGTPAVAALRRAADDVFDATRIQVSLKSAYRSLARQQDLFQQNCGPCIRAHPDTWQQVCTSSMCHPETCNPWKSDGCPHPSGRALDVQCKDQAHSWGDCQLMLERKMLDQGFCRLKSELWHFELPAASGANCISTQPNPATGEREGCFRADGVTPCCNSKTGANCSFSGG
jgi:D-alanyl-D-alanine dipeptidase